jgi:endo-1,4-beta-xylanase
LPETQKSVTEFANAMQNAGVNIAPEEILQQGLTIEEITGVDGKKYEFAVAQGKYPLMMRAEGGEWVRSTPKAIIEIRQPIKKLYVLMNSFYVKNPSKHGGVQWLNIGKDNFQGVVNEQLKWRSAYYSFRPNQQEFDFTVFDYGLDYAVENNLDIFSMHLVEGNIKNNTEWEMSVNSKEDLLKMMDFHIKGVIDHVREKTDKKPDINRTYSVLNEFYAKPFWENKLRSLGMSDVEFISFLFNKAREYDPKGRLIYNEGDVEIPNAPCTYYNSEVSTKTYNVIKKLKENNVPIDAIGFQMHICAKDFQTEALATRTIDSLRENIEKYKALGVSVDFTELDIRLEGLGTMPLEKRYELQGKAYAMIIQLAIQEGIDFVSIFGVSDKDSWFVEGDWTDAAINDPLLFDRNNQPKLAFFEIQAALFSGK